ncbi:MAG: YihY/virulence factor BrkB family protein [Planctomycetales bacterium]
MFAWKNARLWPALRAAVRHWIRDDGFLLSAGLAYYASVSLFPICMVLFAGLGYLSQVSFALQDQQGELLAMVERNASPWLADQLRHMLAGIKTQAAVGGPLGLITLLVTAGSVFVQLDASIAKIWGLPAGPARGIAATIKAVLHDRLVAFLLLLGVGSLVLVVFVLNLMLTGIRPFVSRSEEGRTLWQFVPTLVTIGLNCQLFAAIYKILPKASVRWRDAAAGGLLTAITWQIGQRVLESFVIADNYSAYGVVGSFLAVMLWMYYGSAVILLGAEFVRVLDTSDRFPVD